MLGHKSSTMTPLMTVSTKTPMRYQSTRGSKPSLGFSDILLAGLADDGGLFLPETYPKIRPQDLAAWRRLDYADLAAAVLSRLVDDIASNDLTALCRRTYTAARFAYARGGAASASQITPLTPITGNLSLLELSNGPTLAFKDMAMQLLGELFEWTLKQRGGELNILGATSGDTGSAAEYALCGRAGLRVFMLSPHQQMSPFQRAQMYSLHHDNIHNIAVTGVFDQAQDVVKAIGNDHAFKAKYHIGAVNSINWARIAAQIVYYVKGYLAASRHEDDEVDFAVPSGNFGNICAGHIARQMGLPIRRLVLATNENNVLDEFFTTGVYRPRRPSETAMTSSPSMDIAKASNFERFVFDLVGGDAAEVRRHWQKIDEGGAFDLSGSAAFANIDHFGIVSGSSCHADRLATIGRIWREHHLLIDPHTADGLFVAERYKSSDVPMLVLETAQPVKFTETVEAAIGQAPPRPDPFVGIETRPQRLTVLPADAEAVGAYIAAHCA